ncbi:hypothetical protein K1T71_000162 [Dendrolimus kikuchii]|uniref:Uncharacterized protein n=1 Tax=Dendrolimus kikuchii TaxID=765133 RepID=A0ACC1DID7_9NEOP|nr:hypothetical protein K1T71_000162 [Dendrolimus kikuchii]
MAASLSLYKLREKLFLVFTLLIICVSIIYLYLNHLQENYNSIQWSGERCLSELTSIKYQLNVVTEYKNKIDKLLTETQKAYEADKEKFKDVMESCIAMKQQSSICQNQFEDLQSECKKAKENLNIISKELEKLKTGNN